MVCSLVSRSNARGLKVSASSTSSVWRAEFLGPVEGEVEVAAPIVNGAEFAARRTVLIENASRRSIQRVGENLCAGIASALG